MELIVKNVTKRIREKMILDDVSMHLSGGNVYGIVGRNGSGKTMLLRALAGLIRADEGEIWYQDQLLHKDMDVPPSLGIIIENAGLYPEFTGMKNLRLLAAIKKTIGDKEIREAMERVGLDPEDKRTYRKYSLGMKQRLLIAQAIMEKPDVLLLDEPANGLDEEAVGLMRRIVEEERKRGALILLASHNKEDIGLLADTVYRMEAGCLREEAEQ